MSILAGCSALGSAGYHGTLADLQNPPTNERLPGMDTLRHQIRQGPVIKNGPVYMLANGQTIGPEFRQSVLTNQCMDEKGQANAKKIL